MDCDELVKCPKSLIATSRLSKKTHKSVAKRADGSARAARAPDKAAEASAALTRCDTIQENPIVDHVMKTPSASCWC
jgi:hypothetical protein